MSWVASVDATAEIAEVAEAAAIAKGAGIAERLGEVPSCLACGNYHRSARVYLCFRDRLCRRNLRLDTSVKKMLHVAPT